MAGYVDPHPDYPFYFDPVPATGDGLEEARGVFGSTVSATGNGGEPAPYSSGRPPVQQNGEEFSLSDLGLNPVEDGSAAAPASSAPIASNEGAPHVSGVPIASDGGAAASGLAEANIAEVPLFDLYSPPVYFVPKHVQKLLAEQKADVDKIMKLVKEHRKKLNLELKKLDAVKHTYYDAFLNDQFTQDVQPPGDEVFAIVQHVLKQALEVEDESKIPELFKPLKGPANMYSSLFSDGGLGLFDNAQPIRTFIKHMDFTAFLDRPFPQFPFWWNYNIDGLRTTWISVVNQTKDFYIDDIKPENVPKNNKWRLTAAEYFKINDTEKRLVKEPYREYFSKANDTRFPEFPMIGEYYEFMFGTNPHQSMYYALPISINVEKRTGRMKIEDTRFRFFRYMLFFSILVILLQFEGYPFLQKVNKRKAAQISNAKIVHV